MIGLAQAKILLDLFKSCSVWFGGPALIEPLHSCSLIRVLVGSPGKHFGFWIMGLQLRVPLEMRFCQNLYGTAFYRALHNQRHFILI